ncbi:hypothetical protein RclHR1_09180005 [Rhizophagus clarus]|uniref:Uncharacterized protein n=1 Tax=Rhizophagus clarus TaxID=94130 RepID=A0A2Z6S5S3_9GLOM|nr:hypothetical protein RclHR1_09180005 [Rhizophagus clarus]
MDNNPSQNNYYTETNNLQQSTTIVNQPGHNNSSDINYNLVNVDLSTMNDNIVFSPHTNINHFNQQLTSNIPTSQSYFPPTTSSYSICRSTCRSRLKIPLI